MSLRNIFPEGLSFWAVDLSQAVNPVDLSQAVKCESISFRVHKSCQSLNIELIKIERANLRSKSLKLGNIALGDILGYSAVLAASRDVYRSIPRNKNIWWVISMNKPPRLPRDR